MTTVHRKEAKDNSAELKHGAHMDRERFHLLYEQMPADFRAELIGGVVHEPSPVSRSHGKNHALLGHILGTYENKTPGVELLNDSTVMLGDQDEVQPDLLLGLRPEVVWSTRLGRQSFDLKI